MMQGCLGSFGLASSTTPGTSPQRREDASIIRSSYTSMVSAGHAPGDTVPGIRKIVKTSVREASGLRRQREEGGGLGNRVGVAPALRPGHGGFEPAPVAQAGAAAAAVDRVGVDGDDFGDRQVDGHFASRSWSDANRWWLAS